MSVMYVTSGLMGKGEMNRQLKEERICSMVSVTLFEKTGCWR